MSDREALAGETLEAADGLRLAGGPETGWRVAWGGCEDWLGPLGCVLRCAGGDTPALWAAGGDATALDPGAKALSVAGSDAFEARDELGAHRGFSLRWEAAPLPVRASVRAYAERPVLVFRLEATDAIEGLSTGRLTRPSALWPWLRPTRRRPGLPAGTRGFGHQMTEFAFPTFAGPELSDFLLFPHRPRALAPLWLVASDGRCLLLAPLDHFHDQVMVVPPRAERGDEGVQCGWHGDLDRVPAGFATELAVWAAPGPRRALEAWAGFLRDRHAPRRPSRYADASVARLSYWTDNGAAYWYRTEPGRTVGETLVAVADGLRAADVPVAAWELDSWFYPHEVTRPVNPEGQEHVPPTGLLAWEPREDLLPEGVDGLRQRLGNPPLILHGRHLSSRSPYFERYEAWLDGDRGHPREATLFDHLMGQAAGWGAISFEQDWLVEMFLGVRGLREVPGRARAWQEGLDRAAGEHGLSLIWCMATPADFLQTLTLSNVAAIRTSGDYRYLSQNAAHWVRFLYTNALARALGLLPFKDVFLSRRDGEGLDGDPLAEVEALLAALSAGPVGIGDRVGRTDRALVLRTCRADGVLVKPDVPIAALERCFLADCRFEPNLLAGEAWSDHPAGRWHYLASFNAWEGGEVLRARLALADLGPGAPRDPVFAWDWRRGRGEVLAPDAGFELALAPDAWDYRVLCPLLPGGLALVGDPAVYATAGDRRVRDVRAGDGALELDVVGARGETVSVVGWSERPVTGARAWAPDGRQLVLEAERDAASGTWRVAVPIGPRGWLRVRIEARA